MLKVFNLKVYALLAILFLALFLFVTKTHAQTPHDKSTTLDNSQTIEGDYFAANSVVNLEGKVDGDAFLAGGNVNVDGVINGDLLVAGGNVNIKGKIAGSVRAVGGQVTISGEVARNVSSAGGNVSITGGRVGGNVNIAAGDLSIAAPVLGQVNAAVGQLNVSSGAVLSKDLSYWSQNPATISKEASISGIVNEHMTQQKLPNPANAARRAFILFLLISLFTSAILGLLLIKLMPLFTLKTAQTLVAEPLKSFLIGFVTIILLPIAIIALFITIFGIPLALLLIAILFMLFFVARIFSAIYLGRWIISLGNQKEPSLYGSLLLGLVCLWIISYIPIIGSIAMFILSLMGVGAALIEKKNLYLSLRKNKLL